MSKVNGPLFSLDAVGSLNKSLTYRKRLQVDTVSKYSKPGSKSAFESSPRQKDQRGIISLITTRWSCMSTSEQAPWETLAKESRKPLSGYHLFLHTAKTNLLQYLGLIGYWSMNYNINNSVPDLSGNSNHGILKPSYPSDCPTPSSSVNNKFGKSYKFNGTGDFIDCGNNPVMNSLTEISYELWFYHNSPTTQSILVNEYPKFIYTGSLPRIVATFGASITYAGSICDHVYLADTWYHLVLTYSDSGDRKIYFYLNGVEVDYIDQHPAEGTLDPDTTWPFTIGAFPDGSLSFQGNIDEVRIFNRVLGLTEIKKHSQMFLL